MCRKVLQRLVNFNGSFYKFLIICDFFQWHETCCQNFQEETRWPLGKSQDLNRSKITQLSYFDVSHKLLSRWGAAMTLKGQNALPQKTSWSKEELIFLKEYLRS